MRMYTHLLTNYRGKDYFIFLRFYGVLKCFCMLLCMLCCTYAHTQGRTQGMDMSAPEKIYLQLDAKDYATDQIIWFKAIVTDTENHLPSITSGVLYVDLIAPDEQIVSHRLVKLSKGIGSGGFELDNSFEPGRYLIRAYTQWNRNFGNDFMFKSYVRLYNTGRQKDDDTTGNLSLVDYEQGQRHLLGTILSKTTEVAEKQIPVVLDWEHGKDTLILKRNKDHYPLEYPMPEGADWITLTVMEEGFRRSRTMLTNNTKPDLQFFPESGKMVHGIHNKIGFKAMGFDGKGMEVHGELQDLEGNKIADFKSNTLGMGTFIFKPERAKPYQVKALFPTNGDSIFTYSLPKVESTGSVLSVERVEEDIRITAASNELQGKVFIRIRCRGKDYYMIEGPLRKGRMVSELASSVLPEGILSLTLMDSQKNAIAERLYYNASTSEHLNIAVRTDKPGYGRRQKTELHITIAPNETSKIPADLSVLVMNKQQWDKGTNGNIRSYFLLDSELRGEVADAGHYFRPENIHRDKDMDALLLTQGWRNYNYPAARQGRTFFWPEKTLMVKGTAIPTSHRKTGHQKSAITLGAFGEKSMLYTQETDTMGRFQFELDDFYGKHITLLLSAKNTKDATSKYKISLDAPKAAEIAYEVIPEVEKITPIQQALITAKERRDRTNMVSDSLYGVTQLDEVVVEGYRLTPQRTRAYKQYGAPDVIIKGDMIREKEKKWSFGLFSILMFNYGDHIEIEQFPDGFMLANIKAGSREPTLLAVDGRLITKGQYGIAPNMPPGIIESVELIKYANNFKYHYISVFPETDVLEAPSLGHIISIYTKGNVGMYATGSPPPGTLNYIMESFSPVKEFYTPKYDAPIPPVRTNRT